MTLSHLALGLPPLVSRGWAPVGKAGIGRVGFVGGGGDRRVWKGAVWAVGLSSGRGRLGREDLEVTAEGRAGLEIPVTCYQLIGIPEQAEKDEIVKSVMELKAAEVEDGYTRDAILSRQSLLMDVRDKLLFEPEYAGNMKEKIPPKSSLRISWASLPGALCLLQEVGEEKMVLEIGRIAIRQQDAKPHAHDLLLAMALAECSMAKASFEKNKVSQGFEALARAQYILRSNSSFENMPLLLQIEESLEELAPTCTLEILCMPCSPDNVDKRSGAVAALRELLRQGLDVEASCRVQDWPAYLSQALKKLSASEIVELLPWDDLAITRKNKKSVESQSQRTVIEFGCFYLVMIAHIALGFSRRQIDLIKKAKTICECLAASEGIDLKFEDGICSLLVQDAKAITNEKLHQLETNGYPVENSKTVNKDVKGSTNVSISPETFLKDAVLDLFVDTRGCSPSLANFFRGQRKSNQMESKTLNSRISLRSSSFNLSSENLAPKETLRFSSDHLGEAVKQLAPANLQNQIAVGKDSGGTNASPIQLKRELGVYPKKFWDTWWVSNNFMKKIAYVAVVGCVAFTSVLLLYRQTMRITYSFKSSCPNVKPSTGAWTMSSECQGRGGPALIDKKKVVGRLAEMFSLFGKQLNPSRTRILQNTWPGDECSTCTGTSNLYKRQMLLSEAEALVKSWQAIKAEALGPSHEVAILSEVLADPMLAKWQNLADTAKVGSSFWRFVLLKTCVLRADILSDGVGEEKAEIEAVLEEAAELVDGSQSQPKNQNYYSTYKMSYLLRRQLDGSWKFCEGEIQTSDD